MYILSLYLYAAKQNAQNQSNWAFVICSVTSTTTAAVANAARVDDSTARNNYDYNFCVWVIFNEMPQNNLWTTKCVIAAKCFLVLDLEMHWSDWNCGHSSNKTQYSTEHSIESRRTVQTRSIANSFAKFQLVCSSAKIPFLQQKQQQKTKNKYNRWMNKMYEWTNIKSFSLPPETKKILYEMLYALCVRSHEFSFWGGFIDAQCVDTLE